VCVDAFVVDDGVSLLVPHRRDSHLMLMMTILRCFDVDNKSFVNETSKYLPASQYLYHSFCVVLNNELQLILI
jgi:hypothetical protein